jgi:demethylmenaquinone methyltransferase/2-methoxy-6-polyprenyl-1,4-benzoquinol methylase
MSDGIKKLFSLVPHRYEFVNHLLTFGLDRRWRRIAAQRAALGGGARWMDVCTGTGEMARNLLNHAPGETSVYAADFSVPMLQKAREKEGAERMRFIEADVRSLPFEDNYFDLLTISFATRNINSSAGHLMECLKEFHRVLKPGGRFVNLETSQPDSKLVRFLFHQYVKYSVNIIGGILSASKRAYSYLAYTIPRFYSSEIFSTYIQRAGFSSISVHRMFGGVVALHKAEK